MNGIRHTNELSSIDDDDAMMGCCEYVNVYILFYSPVVWFSAERCDIS